MLSRKMLFFIVVLFVVFIPLITLAGYGLDETAIAAELTKTAPGDLPVLIGKVLGTGLSLVGVLFFALMLYGGLTWMLARGNSEQESKALDTITAAIIGIVIVLASYAITNFVFKSIGPDGGGSTVAAKKCQISSAKTESCKDAADQASCEILASTLCKDSVEEECKKNTDNCAWK